MMMPDKDDCKEAEVNQVGRRAFCGQMAGGLGAIALASLLEQDGCLAAPADIPFMCCRDKQKGNA